MHDLMPAEYQSFRRWLYGDEQQVPPCSLYWGYEMPRKPIRAEDLRGLWGDTKPTGEVTWRSNERSDDE